jgi:molybdopterin/thiamine biosynthesis adenylyltransferase
VTRAEGERAGVAGFTDEQALRYVRQVTVGEIGAAGQERLLGSSAAIVGAGGLGCPALLYLAAAGVGRITVIDSDAVDVTNLQRQIAHRTRDIGRNKARSAADAALALNPTVDVAACGERLTASNAFDLLSGHDVVLDCTDNFAARYVVNDACVLLGTPLVTASVMRFYGQLTVVRPRVGPCLRCLVPQPPEPGTVPTCAQTGIVGPVAGALGSLQAVEALKVLLGLPDTLVGRMFALDALTFEAEVLEIERDPGCPVCGDEPSITQLADRGETCEGRR